MGTLKQARKEVERMDEIFRGRGEATIEPKIFDLVVALRYAGFVTTGSCQGHTKPTKWRYPWVLVMLSEPNLRSKTARETKTQVADAEEKRGRLKILASSFNSLRRSSRWKQRRPPADEEIIIESSNEAVISITLRGSAYIATVPQEILTRKKVKKLLKRYRAAMTAFASFVVQETQIHRAQGRT